MEEVKIKMFIIYKNACICVISCFCHLWHQFLPHLKETQIQINICSANLMKTVLFLLHSLLIIVYLFVVSPGCLCA